MGVCADDGASGAALVALYRDREESLGQWAGKTGSLYHWLDSGGCAVSVRLVSVVDRRFWEELFHQIDYQKEYDYSQSLPAYFVGTAALSVPFVAAAHYGKRLLTGRGLRGNRQK